MVKCCLSALLYIYDGLEIFPSIESPYFLLGEGNCPIYFRMYGKITSEIGIPSTFVFGSFLSDDDIACNGFLSSEHLDSPILRFRIPEVFCRSTGLFVCHYPITNN